MLKVVCAAAAKINYLKLRFVLKKITKMLSGFESPIS